MAVLLGWRRVAATECCGIYGGTDCGVDYSIKTFIHWVGVDVGPQTEHAAERGKQDYVTTCIELGWHAGFS